MYFEKLWTEFSKLQEVEAIVLGGSRAMDNFDEKSDYDLYIYCSEIPAINIREQILTSTCDYMELGNHFWELEDDCTLKDGVDIDILYRNLDIFTQEVSSVVESFHVHNGYTTCMWHNLLYSKILYDRNGSFKKVQGRFNVHYPEQLKTNIIQQNMRLLTQNLPSYDKQIKKALKRNDLLSINHRITAFLESYFDIIFALNELTHPGEKRMLSYVKKHAKILPENFEENIQILLKNAFFDSEATIKTLEEIIDNICRVLTI